MLSRGKDRHAKSTAHTIRSRGARRDREGRPCQQVFDGKLIGGSEELQKFLTDRGKRNPATRE